MIGGVGVGFGVTRLRALTAFNRVRERSTAVEAALRGCCALIAVVTAIRIALDAIRIAFNAFKSVRATFNAFDDVRERWARSRAFNALKTTS